ncbi:Oidioi.mRNA.OKI2018_I69.chr1.g1516.t1.cds [Oikopleura dioica]|uniref:Oidioi.mRNA.OKI2018_I69.chr1.g1516.t1.cds n=1 Tax=Oikopleura dioica TaxID=34765 RepID=A0ABN7STF2_OIKDI|nr:Oidioi.mRNA.OKI2018_I69.chr1.g1516.t1.cds [Oikopleura dioica]
METERRRTLDALKNELHEKTSKSEGVKLSFAIQKPPKRKPSFAPPAIHKRTKKAKISRDDLDPKEKKIEVPEEFKKLAKAVGLPKDHLEFFYEHRESFHWEMKKDNHIYCTGRRGNCKFNTTVKKNCLAEHMISDHNHGEFKCQEENCQFVGFSKGNLKRHKAHFHGMGKVGYRQNRVLQCKYCDYSSSQQKVLDEHQAVHENTLQHCEFCTYTCATMANLKNHLFAHFNIRPFECEICSSTFASQAKLNYHKRAHFNDFSCNHCLETCQSASLLFKHLKKCKVRIEKYHESR